MFDSQDRRIHFGLLIIRLGLTAVLFLHALPKLFDGLQPWENVGMGLNAINMGTGSRRCAKMVQVAIEWLPAYPRVH